MDIHRVSLPTLPSAWPVVGPLLQPCVDLLSGEYQLEDVYRELEYCNWQLWAITQDPDQVLGAVVTEVVKYPRKKVLRVVLLGGNAFERWIDLFRFIEDWGVSQGCSGAEAWCRPGMSKHMRELDFVPKCTVYLKDLQEPDHEVA